MRPPFRSASFPCLRQWGACCPPRVAKTLQRGCTSLRPSCWPLDLVGKCSLAPLARPWLGRLAPLASLRLSLALLGFGSGFACLGYTPPARFERAPSVSQFRSIRSFVSPLSLRKKKRYFREKRAFKVNAHFSRKWNVWFFSAIATKNMKASKYFT